MVTSVPMSDRLRLQMFIRKSHSKSGERVGFGVKMGLKMAQIIQVLFCQVINSKLGGKNVDFDFGMCV